MQNIRLFILLIMTLAAVGCGSKGGIKTYYVEGTVTLDGEPLEDALITFIPVTETPGSKTAGGKTDASGMYVLTSDSGLAGQGAVAGDYLVTIRKVKITAVPRRGEAAPTAEQLKNPYYQPPAMDSIQTVITPRSYAAATTTPLRATVTKGKNEITFDLTSTK